ncbi:MAG: thioredoxin family protein [Bacteroidales bacterium]|nr:thioredoxin family protein [Bacteroidales bacterium]
MKKFLLSLVVCLASVFSMSAQSSSTKLYDEQINITTQIDNAVRDAKKAGKYVVCQVGGNWCIWCTRFAEFIAKDAEIAKVVKDNFVYIHVNYDRKNPDLKAMKRLENPGRFGFPSLVVLNSEGKVIHIQDSGLLESGQGYDQKKVLNFFSKWTPKAVTTLK